MIQLKSFSKKYGEAVFDYEVANRGLEPTRRDTAQWAETVRNRRIQFIDKNLFPMSSGVSE